MPFICITGPSCAGKTTLYHAIRANLLDSVHVPRRILTRPPRPFDESDESVFLSAQDFLERRDAVSGDIMISWQRSMEEGRSEWYGFFRADIDQEMYNVLSCNNALLLSSDTIEPKGFLEQSDTYVVFVDATQDVRRQRMMKRSPEFSVEEAQHRLEREEISKQSMSRVDLYLENNSGSVDDLYNSFLRWFRKLT